MNNTFDIVVIGGGATGVGIARDAALRGFSVTVVERDTIGSGTSGHFHGILHSGARYVTNDPVSASECYAENQILRRIASSVILDTGGLFVAITDEDVAFSDLFYESCKKNGIPVTELSLDDVLKKEPLITQKLQRAFSVPDGFFNGKELLKLNKEAAQHADKPTQFLEHHVVTGFEKKNNQIIGVTVKSDEGAKTLECNYVINAAGIWANQISQLANIEIKLDPDKGSMIVFEKQLTSEILNRCRKPSDGDFLVATGKHSIMGTTSIKTNDLETHAVTQSEIDSLIREGSVMVPEMEHAKIIAMYSGVRPLIGTTHSNGRDESRSFQVINHESEGVDNFISVIGGKFVVYRKMAEAAMDVICEKKGVTIPCQTAEIPLG